MLTLHAPAKINWFLHVLRKRPDGFHDIRSLIQCIDLYDTLVFEESGTVDVITGAPIPAEDNLVFRAAALLKNTVGTDKGARITLRKNIPLSAGLGGGSSDAAAALKGLCRLWNLELPEARLMELAARLGSDVPFFVQSAPAIAEGRGERLTPVEIGKKQTLLLVKPPLGVSSGWAYHGITEFSRSGPAAGDFIHALDTGDLARLGPLMQNDLELPVLSRHPELGELKRNLLESGAAASLMSGSGPTVFGVYESRERAEQASRLFAGHWWAVVETLS